MISEVRCVTKVILTIQKKKSHFLPSFRPFAGPEQKGIFWELRVVWKLVVLVCRVHGRQSYPNGDTDLQADLNSNQGSSEDLRVPGKHIFVLEGLHIIKAI